MIEKIKKANSLFIGFVAFLIAVFLMRGCEYTDHSPAIVSKTDTVEKVSAPKQNLISYKKVESPAKVVSYKEKYPEVRNTFSKDDLITSIHIHRRLFKNELRLTKIDTLGAMHTSIYNIKDFKEINIDHIGQVEIKRKKSKKIINKVIFIGGSIILASVFVKIAYYKWQKKHY